MFAIYRVAQNKYAQPIQKTSNVSIQAHGITPEELRYQTLRMRMRKTFRQKY